MTPELTLYHFESCPFCIRVRRFMAENEIHIPLKDTLRNSEYREELIHLGGKKQVPALSIDGKILYESLDIIDWMRINLLDEREVA